MAAPTRARPRAQERAVDVVGRVVLVTGPEEFLGERVVGAVRAAVRDHDAEAEISEAAAADLTLATLGELAAPSLFSTTRCVVVRGLEDLPEESVDGLLGYCAAPVDDVTLVLVHGGGPRGSGVLNRLRALDPVVERRSEPLRGSDWTSFVGAEVAGQGGQIDRDAARSLVDAVGQDLRGLAAAASQLVADFPGQPVTPELVRRYFGGRAEATSFAVADHAFSGRRAAALEELRWALDAGTAPVLVTSAFAAGVRSLARLTAAPRGQRDADVARVVGCPPWKLRTLREQARGWSDDTLAAGVRAVAQADADVKGAAHDASYTLERLVLTVTGLHAAR